MAELSKSKKLKRYQNRLNHARQWRKDEGYDNTWHRMVDLYKGKHFPLIGPHEDRIAINLAFSTINVVFPSISINHPKIEVLSNKAETEDHAVISEAVINYWWKHYDFRTPFRSATKDFLIIGHGWIKVGYRYKEAEQPVGPNEKEQQFQQLSDEADQFASANPDLADVIPTDEEIEANLAETKLVIVEDRPFIERVSPFDMFVDPEATCLGDARWIAQRIIRPLEDVKNDKKYRQGIRQRVSADAVIRADWLSQDERKKMDSDIDRVTVWEYYDLRANTVAIFSEGSDDFLVEPQTMPYAFGHPFEFIANYEIPDDFYPMGDLEMLEDAQQELNKTRSQMMNHRKKYGRKYLYRASALSPQGRGALESSDDNVMAEVVDDNMPLQDVIIPVPITPMSGDLYQYSSITEADMDKISGVNEYARGAAPETRRTATEASIIQDAANARAADKLGVVEVAIGRIARKVLQLAQQYMTQEQVAHVVGKEGQQVWVPFTYRDIRGEFDFSVEGGSTQPQNDTFRRQQAVAMMNALGPLVGQVIDPVAIAKHVLQTGFGVKNAGKFIMQQPPMPPPGSDGAGAPPNAGVGVDAPQMPAQDVLAAQQNPEGAVGAGVAPTSSGGQIPPEILQMLMAQQGGLR